MAKDIYVEPKRKMKGLNEQGKADTIELDMTIEESLRFTISGGVITPAKHQAFKALANKQDGEHV